jgi:ribosomal protein L30E
MKKIILTILCFSFLSQAFGKEINLRITNPCSFQRHEIIEINANTVLKDLNTDNTKNIIIKNTIGQQILSQFTYNGKLIIDVSVRPYSTTSYTISTGMPKKMKIWVQGKMYPQRKEDIAWENDRCAYRVYGPALEKTGEKAYGIDVWVKNTPDLVIEKRYNMDITGVKETTRLKQEGKNKKALDNYLSTSFHIDHGYGYDPYQVGPSLGCGAPALMEKGKIIFPYCYKDYRILDNGPIRFTVELTYNPTLINDNQNVTEHRLISLDKGSNFNKMTVWYNGLNEPTDLAAGVVIHKNDSTDFSLEKNYVEYADPTDNLQGNNSQIYVAAVFTEGIDTTTYIRSLQKEGDDTGHIIGIHRNLKNKEKFTYYFGASWSKYDIRTQDEWKLRIKEFILTKKRPLIIQIQ